MAVGQAPRRLSLWQGGVQTDVEIFSVGAGPALVYLHGPWGVSGDRSFLEVLAESAGCTVYAPRHPGTSAGDPEAIHRIDSLHDLVVYYAEVFDALGLASAPLVGHSFGGMVACEIAATLPGRVSRLVLIDPVGLWRDDQPVKNWMIFSDQERRTALFGDPEGEAARRFFEVPADADARVAALAGFIWSQACTGKFVWPIPDKGLARRIHRVTAPTLVIWGTRDGVISPSYADEFAGRIRGARVERIEGAGHLPHLEQPEAVARLMADFVVRPPRPG
jgi:pimeloyl-ACP methyl ester carboxylesterase